MEGESPTLPPESGGGNVDFDSQLATACEQYFSQKIEFRLAAKGDSHLEQLRNIYQPLNKVVSQAAGSEKAENGQVTKPAWTDGIPEPKVMLFDTAKLQLTWKQPRSIGAALVNVGNTCFFNSVIQCLTYTPPIVSYLHTGDHHEKCRYLVHALYESLLPLHTPHVAHITMEGRIQGFCALCEFRQHCLKVLSANSSVVQPKLVYHLKAIGKNFRLGRQEDAHEFLRYFVDAMQQSCLKMHVCPEKLDAFSKATTVVHQVFGGFHRSRVVCLECKKVSDTYDPLLDISLDINSCSTLTRALQHSTKADLLDGSNRYACPHCKKMTKANKMFTIHRPPNVLTIHLKRFDFSRGLGVKLGTSIDYGEYLDIRPYTSDKSGAPLWYRLYAVVEHLGFSIHSGHYICYVRNSNGIWYCMNDAKVSQTSINNVLRREAYLLFYIRDYEHMPLTKSGGPQVSKPSATTVQGTKVKDDSSFLRTPNKSINQSISFESPGLAIPLVKSKLVRPMGVVSPSTTSAPPKGTAPTLVLSTSPAPTSIHSVSPTPTSIQNFSILLSRAKIEKTKGYPLIEKTKGYPLIEKTKGYPLNQAHQGLVVTAPSDGVSQHGVLPGGSGVPQECGTGTPSVQLSPAGCIVTPSVQLSPAGCVVTPSVQLSPAGCIVTPSVQLSPEGCIVTSSVQLSQAECVADHKKTCNYSARVEEHTNGDVMVEAAVCDVQGKGSPVTSNSSIASVTERQGLLDCQHVRSGGGYHEMTSPVLGRSHCSDFYVPSKSSKIAMITPQVAMVSPQPYVSTKPVARVLPNPKPLPPDLREQPQVSTQADSEESSDSSDDGLKVNAPLNGVTSQHAKSSETTAACCSTPYGPALPKGYSVVAASPLSPSSSHNTHSTSSLKKLKKKKKKKKSRKKRNKAHSDEEHGDKEVGHKRNDEKCIKSKNGSGMEHCKHSPTPSGAEERSDDHYSKPDQSKKSQNQSSSPVVKNEQRIRSKHLSPDHISPDCLEPKGKGKHKSANVVSKEQHEGSVGVPVTKVSVVEWDASLGPRGKGQESKWDGCHQSDVVEKLTAHSHSKLGTVVKSWDGGENSIDSCVSGKHSRRRPRDDWDEELDRGKIKKVKESHKEDTWKNSKNAFQDFQNKKFLHTTNRPKSPFHPHNHKHKHKHTHHHTL